MDSKIFYTITEVSKILKLESYVLRFWEREFSMITPTKQARGKRLYRKEDIAIIKYIKELLYDHGYTIKGANKHLTKSRVKQIINASKEQGLNLSFFDQIQEENTSTSNKAHLEKINEQLEEIEKLLK
ncbi:MAG: MerR family transcriptional regulator [Alphaproteobacteria bacterium]|jgi:DNA-binding transcriptional MerR regulator|nr:MerR family transcriptional regulator [Alphaproteobacteria bacterium]